MYDPGNIWQEWTEMVTEKVLTMDVSDLKDGEIKQLDGRTEPVDYDLGIDNKRHSYHYYRGRWLRYKH